MSPASPSRWFPALAVATLSAALTFILVRPVATDAGRGRRAPPAAVSGEVSLDGELVRDGREWSVRVRAVNDADAARRCRVTAVVTELVDSPMSRVIQLPRAIWETELALGVPARGEAAEQVPIPASVARKLDTARAPSKVPSPAPPGDGRLELPEATITHGVKLGAACPAAKPVG